MPVGVALKGEKDKKKKEERNSDWYCLQLLLSSSPREWLRIFLLLLLRWEVDWAKLRFAPSCLGTWISIFLSQGHEALFPEMMDFSSQHGEFTGWVSGW